MKKSILLTIVLVLFAFIVKADPPKKIILAVKNNTLSIEVVHPVKKTTDHYIDQITVLINGKEHKVIKPTKQSSEKAEITTVVLPAVKSGDQIEVKARCNEFGTKSAKIKI
jgi:desulfoferrodoxin (superoxide reductase-like protein)